MIKICVVGLGHWGPNIIRAINLHNQAEVVAAVDTDSERRRIVGEKFPQTTCYSDFDQCLKESNVDAVVIAAPTEHHHKLASTALRAKKHVLVEKPLAHSSNASRELIELAQANSCILMTGHIFLFNNGIAEMKRSVDSKELGKVLYVRSIRTNLGPIRSDVNALWDLASHDISILNHLFSSIPIKASASAFSLLGNQLEDIAQATLVYPGDRIATVFVSWLDPQKKREITVVGDGKMLVFDDMNPTRPIRIYDKGVVVTPVYSYADTFQSFRMSIHEGSVYEPTVTTGEPLRNECSYFIDCILSDTKPFCDGQNGLEVVKVLEALTESVKQNGCPVILSAV